MMLKDGLRKFQHLERTFHTFVDSWHGPWMHHGPWMLPESITPEAEESEWGLLN